MKTSIAIVMTSLTLVSFLAIGAEEPKSNAFEAGMKDAWMTGKIETVYTLNQHLNPFAIHTQVDQGVVRLSGVVESDIDRDLAGELAKGIEGVVEVKNELTIEPASARADGNKSNNREGERTFSQWVDDATTTAAVKSKLIANANTQGFGIEVIARNKVVTLNGRVASDQAKQLAEQIALNTSYVETVINQLVEPVAK